ncbi:MAG: hypothetical protein CUN53_04150 [Phototrophicales bacterium]|nr:MAG: hypothetical protein CUN53_04150 [Phototrophicales bacterium]
MLSDEIVTALRRLSRQDKLRAMQLLINELAADHELQPDITYTIWSPYETETAAETLLNLLQQDNEAAHE